MEFDVGMLPEPVLILLVGVEIVQDDVKLAARVGFDDAVHEVEKLDAAATLCVRRGDFSGGDFKRCKQCRCAMPLVIVAVTGEGTTTRSEERRVGKEC